MSREKKTDNNVLTFDDYRQLTVGKRKIGNNKNQNHDRRYKENVSLLFFRVFWLTV